VGTGEFGGDGWNPDSERAGGRLWSKDEKNFIGKWARGRTDSRWHRKERTAKAPSRIKVRSSRGLLCNSSAEHPH
jgi:hypothetical protein